MKRSIAQIEVTNYRGEFTGELAFLRTYRTKRLGRTVYRYRWECASGNGNAINGVWTSPEMAIAVALHKRGVRNLEVF